jgi:hypothetical protein
MLILAFQGWFQCRLATDPDPFDERRGVSGPTIALPGEPNFDRIIRLQNPVMPRFPLQDAVGVNVYQVMHDDTVVADHPLVGACVELLDGAKFEGRNWAVAHGGSEPIDPFHLQISGGGITIRRQDLWDPNQPKTTIFDITPQQMARRQPVQFELQSAIVAEATGIVDYSAYRQERKTLLAARLKRTRNAIERLGLQKRIDNIAKDATMKGITTAAYMFLGAREVFQFALNGPIAIDDPDHRLRGTIGTSQLWLIEFWLGGYDCDTLCGYMRGQLSVPFYPTPD